MKGIILAGGSGTRLGDSTRVINKHLLNVYDRPMIMYPIKLYRDMGIHDVCIILGGNNVGAFMDFLGDGSRFNMNFTYRYQNEPNGIAHAIYCAKDFCEGADNIAVLLGDNIFYGLDKDTCMFLKNEHVRREYGATLFLKPVSNAERYGVFDPEKNEIIEKPAPEETESNLAVTGLYMYDHTLFNKIDTLDYSNRGELEVTDLNNLYIKHKRLQYIQLTCYWSDCGTPESLTQTANYIMNQTKKQV